MPEPFDPVKQHDDKAGTYRCPVGTIPDGERLPLNEMPAASIPSPFKLGPMAPGTREGE